MKVYDSERWPRCGGRRICRNAAMDRADVILLNTCHIREKPRRGLSDLGRLRKVTDLRGSRARKRGCRAAAWAGEGARSCAERPSWTVVVGRKYHRLGDLIERAKREAARRGRTGFPGGQVARMPESAAAGGTAFLTGRGATSSAVLCGRYTRGAECSRTVANRARRAVRHGVREITCGQNAMLSRSLGPMAALDAGALNRQPARIDGIEAAAVPTAIQATDEDMSRPRQVPSDGLPDLPIQSAPTES